MQRYFFRLQAWHQGLNLQQKLGLRLMIFALLLMTVGILGMLGIIPNPLPNLDDIGA